MSQPKVAIVYDRANTQFGGAEFLLSCLAQAFPHSDLLTPIIDPNTEWIKQFQAVRASWLVKLPVSNKHHQWLLPLLPLATESLDLSEYQIIISVTSAESKGILTKPNQFHLSYVLTPPRYLYQRQSVYQHQSSWLNRPVIKPAVSLVEHYLKWWDHAAAARPDVVVTLSNQVAKKIQIEYQRHAQVVYPPGKQFDQINQAYVDKIPASLGSLPPFLLSVSRLVEYKRVDLAIKTAINLQTPLIIVGRGIDSNRLLKLSGKHGWQRPTDMNFVTALRQLHRAQWIISFLGNVTDEELVWLYRHTQTVLSLGDEDFGLVPLEAAVFGVPSVISQHSGVAELMPAPKLAAHISRPTIQQVKLALRQIKQAPPKASDLQNLSRACSPKSFIKSMTQMVYHEFHQSLAGEKL